MVFECMYCGKKPDSSENLTLHKFPSDEELSNKWLENMGFSNFNITPSMRLCSQHFDDTSLKKNNKYTTVKNNAVPTIFHEDYKNSCIYCKAKKGDSDKLFHRFPVHDDSLMAQWLENIDLKDFCPTSHSLLCSSHFEDGCYRPNTGRNGVRIKLKAVPTIFSKNTPSGFAGSQMQESSSHEANNLKETIQNLDTNVTCESAMHVDIKEEVDDFIYDKCIVQFEEVMIQEPSIYIISKTAQENVENDHKYTSSPKCIQKSLDRVRKHLALSQYECKKKNQKIRRLQKKVASLKEIVQELRQKNSILESSLVSLRPIADLDGNHLLKRYLKQNKTNSNL